METHPGHQHPPAAGRTAPAPLSARELTGRQLALLSYDFATRSHIDTYFTCPPPHHGRGHSIQALTEIVQRTGLATVLPDAITHDHPHLTLVPLDPPLPTRTVTLLRRTDAYESAATRCFTHLTHGLVRARGYTPTP